MTAMLEKFPSASATSNEVAVVFVHGFTGDRKLTWGRIPEFLAADPQLRDWDLFGFGYESRFRFDILNLWSADAKLEEIATELNSLPELKRYKRLALVAHSMGGLVVQRALVKYPQLSARTSHVVLFGTPSAGLNKASVVSFLKQQVNNMSASGEFIKQLRSDWTRLDLDKSAPFVFLAVAGELDQFVPPVSSIEPFPEPVRRVIPGNHVTMLRADSADAPAVGLLSTFLCGGPMLGGARTAASLAIEGGEFKEVINKLWPLRAEIDDPGAVTLALALDAEGRRPEAIEVLEHRQAKGTDSLGTLAGRYKRRWILERRQSDVDRAFELYRAGYLAATTRVPADHSQAYYHGTNLMYLEMASNNNYDAARTLALSVRNHCQADTSPRGVFWRLATEGDALITLGMKDEALAIHAKAAVEQMNPWQALSIQEQSLDIAGLCGWSGAELERLSGIYQGRVQ